MGKTAKLIGVTITLLFFIFGNIWIFIHRSDGFMFVPASYATIYSVEEAPRIVEANPLGDTLHIKLSNLLLCKRWKITTDKTGKYIDVGPYPKIKLLAGKHTYKIDCLESDKFSTIILKINFVSSDILPVTNSKIPNRYEILSTNIPIGRVKQYSIDRWHPNYPKGEELDEANRIVYQEAGIQDNDHTLLKIEKLVHFLLRKLDNKRGTPTSEMTYSLSPLLLYKKALSLPDTSTVGIWCTEFVEIYNYFAHVAGIPTRRVESGGIVKGIYTGYADGVRFGGHGSNESYIKEQNKWAFVDLYSRILYVYNQKTGKILNTVDLFHINQMDVCNNLTAKVYKSSEIIEVPYSDFSDFGNRYLSEECIFRFIYPDIKRNHLISKIYRYVIDPNLYYCSASIENKHNIKLIFFIGGVIVFTIWIIIFKDYMQTIVVNRMRIKNHLIVKPE